MEFVRKVYEALIKLSPDSINGLAHYIGAWKMYAVLVAIIFAETGLVVTPFLPGDSLLFAVGAVAALPGSPINLAFTALLLVAAAIIGDAVNYFIGFRLGPMVFSRDDSWLLNKKHVLQAQRFYDKYGGKTIILARFVPIVRTFAPFVAGIGRMNYFRFAIYNVIGGAVWVLTFLLSGRWFGSQAYIQKRFHYVIPAIIVISILPAVFEVLRARWSTPSERAGAGSPGADVPAAAPRVPDPAEV